MAGDRLPLLTVVPADVDKARELDDARMPRHADEVALVLHSSGTTSAPKGIAHSSNTLRYATSAGELAGLASVLAERSPELATTMLGAGDRLLRQSGAMLQATSRFGQDALVAALTDSLDERFAIVWDHGAQLSPREASALAMSHGGIANRGTNRMVLRSGLTWTDDSARCGGTVRRSWRQALFSLAGGQYGSDGGVRQPRVEAWSIRVRVARATIGRVSSAR